MGATELDHLNLIGDTAESIAKCFELLINAGSTGVRASSAGAVLTITSRVMGAAGNAIGIAANTNSSAFTATASGATLSGGVDGTWRTDTAATPRINRAARDWTLAYLQALRIAGIDATAAFSMELQHGDDTTDAGLAQRYPNGDAVWLNTPALQTNFGPQSTSFWREVYLEMAGVMTDAGLRPYLQFGEVQWWYFANSVGMTFYDSYTTTAFQAQYGRAMRVIGSPNADPIAIPGRMRVPARADRAVYGRDHDVRTADLSHHPVRGTVSARRKRYGAQSRDQLSQRALDTRASGFA